MFFLYHHAWFLELQTLFYFLISKTDEQMDEAIAHARIIRINARNVGGDIICYRRSLAETDVFLGKIENRGFAFLPLAKEFMPERD